MKNLILQVSLILLSLNLLSQQPAKHKIINEPALSSAAYRSFTFNGAWCWFSDPRAVYYEGRYKRTYTGWVDNYGDIHIAYLDHENNTIHSKVIIHNFEIDDHNNPSILFDEEGKLLVFFNSHMIGVKPLYLVKSKEPENIDEWEDIKELWLNDKELSYMGSMNHTYTNPVKLSAEEGRIYLFWRGIDGKPSYSYSDDNGEKWSTGKIFFMPDRSYGFRRPYTKVYSDGIKRIHFTFTDGHPRKEESNNIYYMYYENGAFYRANGSLIRTLEDAPVLPSETDKVYNASSGNARAWNWDIAADLDGNPIIAYARFPDEENHDYCYARWDGKKWNNYELVNSGKWFPQTMNGYTEPEPHYSGGMNIDHENPDILYLSVNRDSIFEIEKWQTYNGGKKWEVQRITEASTKDNVRPFAIRGAGEGNPVQVLWMQNTKYHHFANAYRLKDMGGDFRDRFHSSVKMDLPSKLYDQYDKPEKVISVMNRVADWQLANPRYNINPLDWHYGAFYTGLRALYETTNDQRYLDELYNIGRQAEWEPMDDIFHADRLTIIDNWAWLSEFADEAEINNKARWALDIHLARNYKKLTDVRFEENDYRFEWWTWCDALFMAPPSFVQMWKSTGKEKYLTYAAEQWWKTSDYLYSAEDSLFFRDDRFFERLSENNKKIFWSRGNGWVIAGLARILDKLPADYPEREKFEEQYRQMAHKLLSLQDPDGLWRVSLIDPEFLDIGESSGSSFFTFALAWGINNELLDSKYKNAVLTAWQALCENVNQAGRLGFVQQVAGSPYPFYEDQWHVYASGAFLLAGSEVYKLTGKE